MYGMHIGVECRDETPDIGVARKVVKLYMVFYTITTA